MGYDVSFHPISPEEMQEWYFTPLSWVQQGQEEKVLALAAQHGMEDFYAEKYLDTLRVGAGTEPDELFDKSHGFYIAVIQGFFRDYYYTRGSAFSFLVEEILFMKIICIEVWLDGGKVQQGHRAFLQQHQD